MGEAAVQIKNECQLPLKTIGECLEAVDTHPEINLYLNKKLGSKCHSNYPIII